MAINGQKLKFNEVFEVLTKDSRKIIFIHDVYLILVFKDQKMTRKWLKMGPKMTQNDQKWPKIKM